MDDYNDSYPSDVNFDQLSFQEVAVVSPEMTKRYNDTYEMQRNAYNNAGKTPSYPSMGQHVVEPKGIPFLGGLRGLVFGGQQNIEQPNM